VPVGATIEGITVRLEASEHSPGNESVNAQLQDHTGALIGSGKATTVSGTAKAVYTYGAVTDLWAATLTVAIVNSATFGVRFWYTTSHNVAVDFVTMAVEYSLAAAQVPEGIRRQVRRRLVRHQIKARLH
jgi:hypothetical protein